MKWFTRRQPEALEAAPSSSRAHISTDLPGPRSSEPAGAPASSEASARQREAEPRAARAQPRAREAGHGVAGRTRDAGASAVGTLGSGALLLARLVMTAATLIAVLIALAIVLRDVDANQGNTIVKGIHEGANFFAGAFTGLITFSGHPKRAITVDWGIALVVYLLVGALIASMIARIGRGGLRFERSHRVAPTP
jgi:hypothetical protein